MTVLETIKTRRSTRSYLSTPVEKEKLDQLLEAARLAPGARLEQDFKIIVVTDEKLRKGLADACESQRFIAQAPLALVMCYNNERIMLCGQPVRPIDCSIALSFMLLEAEELGLGMCWMGAFRSDDVRHLLNIPDEYTIFAMTPVGYATSKDYPPRRKPKEMKDLLKYNKWQEEQ
ncbi:MAG: nitroreductase family protein [Anaerovoracaceae bacterium]